jgi:hypothetical protein
MMRDVHTAALLPLLCLLVACAESPRSVFPEPTPAEVAAAKVAPLQKTPRYDPCQGDAAVLNQASDTLAGLLNEVERPGQVTPDLIRRYRAAEKNFDTVAFYTAVSRYPSGGCQAYRQALKRYESVIYYATAFIPFGRQGATLDLSDVRLSAWAVRPGT